MDGDELLVSRRALEPGDGFGSASGDGRGLLHVEVGCVQREPRGRKRGQEFERQFKVGHGLPEFRPCRSVPGNDGIEGAEFFNQTVGRRYTGETEQIQAGGRNGTGAGGEAGQRQVSRGSPDLGVAGP